MVEQPESANPSVKNHGRLYWLVCNLWHGLTGFVKKHKLVFLGLTILLLFAIFVLRCYLHPVAIWFRKHTMVVAIIMVAAWLSWRYVRHHRWKAKLLVFVSWIVIGLMVYFWSGAIYNYLALYYRYSTLTVVELKELPTTDHERIQPLNSVYSLALEAMAETESPTTPDFVRFGDKYIWTLAIEPAFPIPRLVNGVNELMTASGTSLSPDFSKKNRIKVSFDTGENLMLSRNCHNTVIKTLGFWRFWHYQPADVAYIPDDNGEWVQVVSLIRWEGWFFPRPQFGGVCVIRQHPNGSPFRHLKRMLIGDGVWIKPEEIPKHRFLVGQNILPYVVSRYIGNSFRFQNGFLAPLPGYHRGDIRIPNLPEDVNDQPFTAYFKMSELGGADALYHFFALEPYDQEKQGLNTSLFIPADGANVVYVYKHRGSTTGVSAIASKVMESRKNFDWSQNRPVEHRPYIKKIDGQTRFFWMTTVVTFKEKTGQRFVAGVLPDIVITDAEHRLPVWVNPRKPELWIDQLRSELTTVWAQ